LEVVATAIYLLNFYSGSSVCPVTAWIIQGCEAVVKMTQFRLRVRSCWFLCQSIYKQKSPNWLGVLHSLHALPVAALAVSANSAARANHAKSAKHIVDSRVLFQTRTHLH